MLTIAELPLFTKQAEALFTETEKAELISFLSWNPLVGDIIPGGHGRCAETALCGFGPGQTWRSASHYYYLDDHTPLYVLLAYPKNAKTDLTGDEKRMAAQLVEAIKGARRRA
jgi:hypothetical protein